MSETHEEKTAALAAVLDKFEPDDAVVALCEMLACNFAFAGILPGSPEFERALLGCRGILSAKVVEMHRAMAHLRPTRH